MTIVICTYMNSSNSTNDSSSIRAIIVIVIACNIYKISIIFNITYTYTSLAIAALLLPLRMYRHHNQHHQ